jgi:hypothetical protein
MKAEERKKLETNLLADRMGRTIQSIKKPPKRKTILIILGVLLLLVGVTVGYVWYMNSLNTDSAKWMYMYELNPYSMEKEILKIRPPKDDQDAIVIKKDYEAVSRTPQGKIARLNRAWLFLWNNGIQRLGSDPDGSLKAIKKAKEDYTELQEDCKDNPLLHAESMYGLAVAEESLAVEDPKHLKDCKELYGQVKDKYEDTIWGQRASERLKELEDTKSFAVIQEFYRTYAADIREAIQRKEWIEKFQKEMR